MGLGGEFTTSTACVDLRYGTGAGAGLSHARVINFVALGADQPLPVLQQQARRPISEKHFVFQI